MHFVLVAIAVQKSGDDGSSASPLNESFLSITQDTRSTFNRTIDSTSDRAKQFRDEITIFAVKLGQTNQISPDITGGVTQAGYNGHSQRQERINDEGNFVSHHWRARARTGYGYSNTTVSVSFAEHLG